MKPLTLATLIFINLTALSQSKEKLEAILANYENGKTLSPTSWVITIDGDTTSLASFDGKWLLVDYWSISCMPCLKEIPAITKFAQGHEIPDLEVVAISVDRDIERWKKFGPKRMAELPSYYAGRDSDNDLFALNLSLIQKKDSYQLMTTLPRYSLIDPSGRIVERNLMQKPSDATFKEYIFSLMN